MIGAHHRMSRVQACFVRPLLGNPTRRPIAYSNTFRNICRASSETPRQQVLFISPLWPERSSSAAGVRTCDLIQGFQSWGWPVTYLSAAAQNEHSQVLEESGVGIIACPMNREEDFRAALGEVSPTVCIFDRFYAEEAFSFQVRDLMPNALRVLDMQDVHFLRSGRAAQAKSGASLTDILKHRPLAGVDEVSRELAAIHRSDLTLVCSPMEQALLSQHYGILPAKLALAPFFVPSPETLPKPGANAGFASRRHFMIIGNWRHAPNMDAAKWLCGTLWDSIRKQLGDSTAELHVYGAYPTGAAQQLNAPKRGILFKGFAPSLDIMSEYRVCLAPLRYGAGLKGKVVDAWSYGLPVVTTTVGAEGMHESLYPRSASSQGDGESHVPEGDNSPEERKHRSHYFERCRWGGLCDSSDGEQFVSDAVQLYIDAELWQACQSDGFYMLQACFDRQQNLEVVKAAIEAASGDIDTRRGQDYVGQMLWQQQLRATEYFSRWIELKERAAASNDSVAVVPRLEKAD